MTGPRYAWHYDRERHRYVITLGQWVYQEVIPNRRNPAHSQTYVERAVRMLNKED